MSVARGAAGPRIPSSVGAGIEVLDRWRPRSDRGFVTKVARTTLAFAQREDLKVSVLLTGDAEIARLHGEYLDDPTPTDVLSFPMDDGVDVVVSVERARREAKSRGHTIKAELALYLIHGLLHACGYDDGKDADRARMRKAEQDVLELLDLRVPPVE
jgi:probable rRNA maturation factor